MDENPYQSPQELARDSDGRGAQEQPDWERSAAMFRAGCFWSVAALGLSSVLVIVLALSDLMSPWDSFRWPLLSLPSVITVCKGLSLLFAIASFLATMLSGLGWGLSIWIGRQMSTRTN